MLKAGQAAPMFVLPDADMELIDIARFQGKKMSFSFSTREMTRRAAPCRQPISRIMRIEFARHDCTIIGISRDDCIKARRVQRQARDFGVPPFR
jgi:peroxiredoxin Q/BCP